MKSKGFALVSVLVLSTVLLLMGMGAMYMSEMGFRSLSAEQRWHTLEKAANAGINQVVRQMEVFNGMCNVNRDLNFNGARVEVQTERAVNGCFIWSRATLGDSRVVKTAIIRIDIPLGTANFVKLDDFNLESGASISACDQNCQVPALLTGNDLNLVSGSCSSTFDIGSNLSQAYVPNAFLPNENLTSRVFLRASKRDELLHRLNLGYQVIFRPDGTPYVDVRTHCDFRSQYQYCEVKSEANKIQCGSLAGSGNNPQMGSAQINITYNNYYSYYDIRDMNDQSIESCLDIALPEVYFYNTFEGGRTIYANLIVLSNKQECVPVRRGVIQCGVSYNPFVKGVTLVADEFVIRRQQSTDSAANISASDVNIFARRLYLDNGIGYWNVRINIDRALMYVGGSDGSLSLTQQTSQTSGFNDMPVMNIDSSLIIVDNKLETSLNAATFGGLVYVTENAQRVDFEIGRYPGVSSFRGMFVSNSRGYNKLHLGANARMEFDPSVLNQIADRYANPPNQNLNGFVRRPQCGVEYAIRVPLIQTKTTAY